MREEGNGEPRISLLEKASVWFSAKLLNGVRRRYNDNPALQERFHSRGIWFLPPGYYASLPTPSEVENSFEYRGPQPPYLSTDVFQPERMRAYLESLKPFSQEFDPPEHDPGFDRYYWRNHLFSYLDALTYYCVIRQRRPQTILEIGSGFSTLVASAALEKNGSGEIVCFEPYPRPWLQKIPRVREVVQQIVQEVPISRFADTLKPGDILFIDSTHTVKAGGDCLYEYLKILPALGPDILVHCHDIFLPEALPKEWLIKNHWCWTEQYLLYAYLLENPRCEVLFGSRYHQGQNAPLLTEFAGQHANALSASLWFRRK